MNTPPFAAFGAISCCSGDTCAVPTGSRFGSVATMPERRGGHPGIVTTRGFHATGVALLLWRGSESPQ